MSFSRSLRPHPATVLATLAFIMAAVGLATGAASGAGAPTFVVRSAEGTNYVKAICPDNETATGGGAQSFSGSVELSRPTYGRPMRPTGWEGRGARSEEIRTYVVCQVP